MDQFIYISPFRMSEIVAEIFNPWGETLIKPL